MVFCIFTLPLCNHAFIFEMTAIESEPELKQRTGSGGKDYFNGVQLIVKRSMYIFEDLVKGLADAVNELYFLLFECRKVPQVL